MADWLDDFIDFVFPENELEDDTAKASREGQTEASNEGLFAALFHDGVETLRDGFPVPRSEEERIRERAYQHQKAVDSKNRRGW
jgi:hypothetical protein